LSRPSPSKEHEPALVAIANPDGSLVFADEGVDGIASRFVPGKRRVAHGRDATRDWLWAHAVEGDFLELSTHGSFVPGRPARSALLLAHPERSPALATARQEQDDGLTLDDLWSGRLPIQKGCVVTLAACETGQVDPGAEIEESLGFPAAFLGLGASSVIASLWAVNDLSTALLMDKVYELLLRPGGSPAAAVQEASRWLRKLPREDARRWLETRRAAVTKELEEYNVPRGGFTPALLDEAKDLEDRLELLEAALKWLGAQPDPPFAHPVFWAAFAAYGA
jgi:CHAT domain-containing protein